MTSELAQSLWGLPPAAWSALQSGWESCQCHDVTVFGHQTWCPTWGARR